MNRTQGIQTVRLPSGGWLLSLIGVAVLAFLAGMGVDGLQQAVPLQAGTKPVPVAAAVRRGSGTGSAYDGSAPRAAVIQPHAASGTGSAYDGSAPHTSTIAPPRGWSIYDGSASHSVVVQPSAAVGTGSASAPRVASSEFPRGFKDYLELNQASAAAAAQRDRAASSNSPAHPPRSWLPPQVVEALNRVPAPVSDAHDRHQAAKPNFSTPPYGMTDHLPSQP